MTYLCEARYSAVYRDAQTSTWDMKREWPRPILSQALEVVLNPTGVHVLLVSNCGCLGMKLKIFFSNGVVG